MPFKGKHFTMKITSIKTNKINQNDDLRVILDKFIDNLKEGSILAITSKIVSLCEGNVIKKDEIEKERLIERESDYFLPASENQYNVTLTIKDNVLIPTAGIDESNVNEQYVLWPRNAQNTANEVRKYLCERFKLTNVGVIITDSKTTPLRWGTTGIAIAHSGFLALNSYIGKKDIFGRNLKMSKSNVMDGLAAAVVVVMGEGNEQTPLAIIEDVTFCNFQKNQPTIEEISGLKIDIKDDIYASLLKSVPWKKGSKKKINYFDDKPNLTKG
jgi:dihydrofolate synthase / folylpolyglutamate synthase